MDYSSVSGNGKRGRSVVVGHHIGKDIVVITIKRVVGVAEVGYLIVVVQQRHTHKFLRLADSRRCLQEKRVHQCENRAVCSDTHTEDKHGHDRETGTLGQPADAVSNILCERLDRSCALVGNLMVIVGSWSFG